MADRPGVAPGQHEASRNHYRTRAGPPACSTRSTLPGHAQQRARVAGAQDRDVPPGARERQVGQGREHLLAPPLGQQHLLQQRDQPRRGRACQHQRAPGHPRAHADRGLGRAVPGHVADHRVHGAVRGLDHIVEVAAEQRLDPARPVAGRGALLGHQRAELGEVALGMVLAQVNRQVGDPA